MYDLNSPQDVIDQFRDAGLTDDEIITVSQEVINILRGE